MRRLAMGCVGLGLLLAGCDDRPGAPPDRDAGAAADASLAVDAGRADDAGAPDAGAPAVTCPPVGPVGTEPGQTAADVRLMDCDGVEHSLHDLCARRAVWLFEFADWCPPCRAFARDDVNAIYARFAGPEFGAWMVISAAADGSPPDATLCGEIRDRYGITMPVLFDPGGRLQSAFSVPSNEINIVLSEGATIEWIGQYSAHMVEDRIAGVLSR